MFFFKISNTVFFVEVETGVDDLDAADLTAFMTEEEILVAIPETLFAAAVVAALERAADEFLPVMLETVAALLTGPEITRLDLALLTRFVRFESEGVVDVAVDVELLEELLLEDPLLEPPL